MAEQPAPEPQLPTPDPWGRRLDADASGWWRDARLRRVLAAADAVAVLVFATVLASFSHGVAYGVWTVVLLPLWLLLAKLNGLYDRDQRSLRHLTVDEAPSIVIWAICGIAVTLVLASEIGVGTAGTGDVVRAWAVLVACAFCLRAVARVLFRRLTPPERTLIIGSGDLAEATRRKIELFPDIHVSLVAERPGCTPQELVARPDWALDVERIILAAEAIDDELIATLVAFCRGEQLKFSVVPPARGEFGTAARLDRVADLPVLEYNTWDVSRSTIFLKRVLDVVGAAVALVLVAPLFGLTALAIALERSGPIFFVQRRAGLHGVPFPMLKFRTMVADAEARLPELVPLDLLPEPMFKLGNDPRVTRVGRVLRRTSLDELPQLLNVLRGDMSLVGPRPEQVELVDRYRPEHRFRLGVKPGVTGPMQVFGRGELTFGERLAVEREYIENISLRRDLRILALTGSAIFRGRGAF